MVDVRTGDVAGFLRFEDAVQEVGAVALLTHPWPHMAGRDDVATVVVPEDTR
jgi:hypothetical protein